MQTPDPLASWCASHPDDLREFAGQYIALSPKGGILAHGMEFSKVHDQAVQKEPGAIFFLVPDAEVMVLWLH